MSWGRMLVSRLARNTNLGRSGVLLPNEIAYTCHRLSPWHGLLLTLPWLPAE